MDTNIEKRQFPLPYPETPSVAEWHAANSPQQPIHAQAEPAQE